MNNSSLKYKDSQNNNCLLLKLFTKFERTGVALLQIMVAFQLRRNRRVPLTILLREAVNRRTKCALEGMGGGSVRSPPNGLMTGA